MADIEGEFGKVSRIECRVGVRAIVFEDGAVPVDINTNKFFNYGVPENCPRVTDGCFDTEEELGCLVCRHSFFEFSEAGFALDNSNGEVLPLQV